MREMKDSGVEWIGEIPEDWEIVQVKYLFKIGRGRVIAQTELEDDGIYPVFSSQTKNDGCLGYINTYDFNISQLTWTTDGANAGTVFLRRGKHNCTNICGTLQPIKNDLDLRYQKYALEYIAFYHKRSDTNGYKIMNNEMASIHTIFPALAEQKYIADYLDKKCTQIDTVIAKQQELIIKLGAYKQSIITEAVTKGLNSNVEMKDSGIEWIGKMPKNWSIHKLCWDYSTMLGKMLDVKRITGQHLHPYIKNVDVEWGNINIDNLDEMDFEDDEIERYSVLSGDLMICEGGEIGKCAIAPDVFPKGIYYQKALHRVRKRERNSGNIKFLYYVIFCMAKNDCFGTSPEKATIAHLPENALKQLRIPAPYIDEQKEIADFLDKKCSAIDNAIRTKRKIVDKLIAYKKSLIYEIVTGKKEI